MCCKQAIHQVDKRPQFTCPSLLLERENKQRIQTKLDARKKSSSGGMDQEKERVGDSQAPSGKRVRNNMEPTR